MQPTVSIMIPAYNAERFLDKTLKSAVQQACPRHYDILVGGVSILNSKAREALIKHLREGRGSTF